MPALGHSAQGVDHRHVCGRERGNSPGRRGLLLAARAHDPGWRGLRGNRVQPERPDGRANGSSTVKIIGLTEDKTPLTKSDAVRSVPRLEKTIRGPGSLWLCSPAFLIYTLRTKVLIVGTRIVDDLLRRHFYDAGCKRRYKIPVMADKDQRARVIFEGEIQ